MRTPSLTAARDAGRRSTGRSVAADGRARTDRGRRGLAQSLERDGFSDEIERAEFETRTCLHLGGDARDDDDRHFGVTDGGEVQELDAAHAGRRTSRRIVSGRALVNASSAASALPTTIG